MSKPSFYFFLFSLLVFLFSGCAKDKPIRVDPTVVSTSYDYTKPVDIAAQSRPVWVLPVINKGWIPARVDPKTGDWVSGHYQATIVQDGYWATQEEAELSGRPYIVAGDSSPIIPTPVAAGSKTGGSGGELDIVNIQNRVGQLENRQKEIEKQTDSSSDRMAALSTQLEAFAREIPSNTHTTTYPANPDADGYSNNIIIQGTPPPGPGDPSAYQTNTQGGPPFFPPSNTPTVVLPPMPAGTDYEIPSNEHLPNKLSVRYLEDNRVEVNYMGRKDVLHLDQPNAHIQLPRTVNLDEP